MNDSEPMQQPPELQFLEMVRNLSATLPPDLTIHLGVPSVDTESYRAWIKRWNGVILEQGEQAAPLQLTHGALAILFHHIAMETFAGLERVLAEADVVDDGDPMGFIKSHAVRNFWLRYQEERRISREARGQELLASFTKEDREALGSVGVVFRTMAKTKRRDRL